MVLASLKHPQLDVVPDLKNSDRVIFMVPHSQRHLHKDLLSLVFPLYEITVRRPYTFPVKSIIFRISSLFKRKKDTKTPRN